MGLYNLNKFCHIFIVWVQGAWSYIRTNLLVLGDQSNSSQHVSSDQPNSSQLVTDSKAASQSNDRIPLQSASDHSHNSSVLPYSSATDAYQGDIKKEHTEVKAPAYRYEGMIGLPRDYSGLTTWNVFISYI